MTTAREIADQLRAHVRTMPGGGEQFLDQLVNLAERAESVNALVDAAEDRLNEDGDRQHILESLISGIRAALAVERKASVILFKASGKYYTEEEWRIPALVKDSSPARGEFVRAAILPSDMKQSPDFRRIDNGPVLIESQDPWGYPWLIMPE